MRHDTSFDVIELLNDVRRFLYGIAGTHQSVEVKKVAKQLVTRIDDAIGEE
jgi:hypothetical protein